MLQLDFIDWVEMIRSADELQVKKSEAMNEIRERLRWASYRYECTCDAGLDGNGDRDAQMTCAGRMFRWNRVPEISKSYHLNGGSEILKPSIDLQSYARRFTQSWLAALLVDG